MRVALLRFFDTPWRLSSKLQPSHRDLRWLGRPYPWHPLAGGRSGSQCKDRRVHWRPSPRSYLSKPFHFNLNLNTYLSFFQNWQLNCPKLTTASDISLWHGVGGAIIVGTNYSNYNSNLYFDYVVLKRFTANADMSPRCSSIACTHAMYYNLFYYIISLCAQADWLVPFITTLLKTLEHVLSKYKDVQPKAEV